MTRLKSKNGQPQSPFLVPSQLTEATITGLTTGSNYLITILTLSGGSISDGVHIHAQTGSFYDVKLYRTDINIWILNFFLKFQFPIVAQN